VACVQLCFPVYWPHAQRDPFRVDRTAFSVGQLHDPSDEKAYWLARSPQERLEAIEVMRQALYGYDPSSTPLQRILTITELKKVPERDSR
jgi:hypothetical protein